MSAIFTALFFMLLVGLAMSVISGIGLIFNIATGLCEIMAGAGFMLALLSLLVLGALFAPIGG